MKITIVTPAPRGSRSGNRVTAERWARLLRELDHQVVITPDVPAVGYDVLVALHARKSAAAVRASHRARPVTPVVLALTGTDVYGDIGTNPSARRAADLASVLVTLQPRAIDELPPGLRTKVRVIYQSAEPPATPVTPSRRTFDVSVVGHLRAVKDPFRAALAARTLPAESNLRVVQVGGALTPAMRRRAIREIRNNPRFRWTGDVPRSRALQHLRRSRLLVLSSRAEGGANVISEAVIAGVPVLASRIPGNVGLLGERYSGYFPVGDTDALSALLQRAESEPRFLRRLRHQLHGLASRFSPDRERTSWKRLLARL